MNMKMNSSATNADISKITALTNEWIHKVVVEKDPSKIANMFCDNGSLVGTVSQVKRTGGNIEKYFDYFAKIPGLNVTNREYNIRKLGEPDIFINTAFITWTMNTAEEPLIARMTFIFRNGCIFQLHSSALPEINEKLLEISGLM